MQTLKVAIAGFGGVGRATANLLLQRRERYRQFYGVDVRLVAVCGSRTGLADANGLQADQLDALQPGLTGPDFVTASAHRCSSKPAPAIFAAADRALPTFGRRCRPGRIASSFPKAR